MSLLEGEEDDYSDADEGSMVFEIVDSDYDEFVDGLPLIPPSELPSSRSAVSSSRKGSTDSEFGDLACLGGKDSCHFSLMSYLRNFSCWFPLSNHQITTKFYCIK